MPEHLLDNVYAMKNFAAYGLTLQLFHHVLQNLPFRLLHTIKT